MLRQAFSGKHSSRQFVPKEYKPKGNFLSPSTEDVMHSAQTCFPSYLIGRSSAFSLTLIHVHLVTENINYILP